MSDSRSTTDLLMRLVIERETGPFKSGPVAGESTLALSPGDTLVSDFAPGQFFEIDDFDMEITLRDETSKSGSSSSPMSNGPNAQSNEKLKGSFSRWRSASSEEYKKIIYPSDADIFSFSRAMDRASLVLLGMCCLGGTFDRASVVKRRSTGTSALSRSFLRIDFEKVLVVGVDWDDGAVIKEKCKFICRRIRITYHMQNPDGSMVGAAQSTWSQKS
jgi:type VI protein secretion system component Hcp